MAGSSKNKHWQNKEQRAITELSAIPTDHATQRVAQRCLSPEKLAYILRHGTRVHRTGITFVSLRRCDIPIKDRSDDTWAKLDGAIVLLGEDRTVITAYRNRKGHRQILKKEKYRRPEPAGGTRGRPGSYDAPAHRHTHDLTVGG